ncbi:MAG: CRISPR-associated helicase Cas3', partial [Zestosphaera sp.]
MTFIDTIYSRPGLERAGELFKREGKLVLIAPTGYGKTVLSLKLYRDFVEEGPWGGLIHVAPYRALVRQIYNEKFKPYVSTSGYQSLDYIEPGDKSPYFLRDLIVTTLDSFIYNLFRIPVAELNKVYRMISQGHYYPIQLSIFTSLIVLDEAHVYLGDIDEDVSIASVVAASRFLNNAGVPLLVESATMHSDLVSALSNNILRGSKIVYVGDENYQVKKLKDKGVSVEVVRDIDFESSNSFNWRTQLISEDKIIGVLQEHCRSSLVLLITNTVKRAVEIYDVILEKGICDKAVLLHGLLSNKDREGALSEISKASAGIVVSTQVVEAGVEFPSRVLITDPAPLENLAQRAGRLCREKYTSIYEECVKEGPLVYIVKPPGDSELDEYRGPYRTERVRSALTSINDVLERGRSIDWRLMSHRENYIPFVELLEKTPAVQPAKADIGASILEEYLKSDATPEDLINVLNSTGLQLTRSGFLVNLLVNTKEVCGRELRDLGELETVSI